MEKVTDDDEVRCFIDDVYIGVGEGLKATVVNTCTRACGAW